MFLFFSVFLSFNGVWCLLLFVVVNVPISSKESFSFFLFNDETIGVTSDFSWWRNSNDTRAIT